MREMKRVDLAKVAKVLGQGEVDKILSAFARDEAKKTVSVTPEQIRRARKLLLGEATGCYEAAALGRVLRKYVTEVPIARKAFLSYLTKLERRVTHGGKAKARRKKK